MSTSRPRGGCAGQQGGGWPADLGRRNSSEGTMHAPCRRPSFSPQFFPHWVTNHNKCPSLSELKILTMERIPLNSGLTFNYHYYFFIGTWQSKYMVIKCVKFICFIYWPKKINQSTASIFFLKLQTSESESPTHLFMVKEATCFTQWSCVIALVSDALPFPILK